MSKYDLPELKWASIFLLNLSAHELTPDFWQKVLAPILHKNWDYKTLPSIYIEHISYKDNEDGTYTISNGPWKGRDTTVRLPYLVSVKYNIRKLKGYVNNNDLADFLSEFRSKIVPVLREYDIKSEYIGISLHPYKSKFKVDKGYPKTPNIPMSFWPLALASSIGAMVAKYKVL